MISKNGILNLKRPFFILALFFIVIGIVLDDTMQINFGLVWLLIATSELAYRKYKSKNTEKGKDIV